MLPSETARRLTGLSEAEATERLRRFGPNELPTARRRGVGHLLRRAVLVWPPARQLLRLASPAPLDVALIAAAALIATVSFDVVKRLTLGRR